MIPAPSRPPPTGITDAGYKARLGVLFWGAVAAATWFRRLAETDFLNGHHDF